VVYKINCESSYVGQTKRKLKIEKNIRLTVRKFTTDISVVSRHQVNEKHELDNVRILDTEQYLKEEFLRCYI